MKKTLGLTIVIVMAVLVFGFAGLAFAQDSTPDQPVPGQEPGIFAPGQMRAGHRGGMQAGFQSGEYGPWHAAVVTSLADAFGMTSEALQTRLDAGETIWQVAEPLGWTGEQLQTEMLAARSAALQQAVADGLLTQEQANFMVERMNQAWPEGYGPGSVHCDGSGRANQAQGRQAGRGQGMRWNSQPAP